MRWSTITWDTARAGGFAAYVLLTLAATAGLILRNRWQSERWPRLITNEVHGYLSLLGLVFIGVHVAALTVDPFTHFGLAEIVLPFVSHYRPLWMGLGIVSLYLLLAVWVSSHLRTRIGHRLWRQIHLLAFLVYAAATVHGLGAGSDTKTGWALAIYGASVAVVGGLTARRLLVPATRGARSRPVGAMLTEVAVAGVATWAVVGPLAAHWGARTGVARAAAVARATRALPSAAGSGVVQARSLRHSRAGPQSARRTTSAASPFVSTERCTAERATTSRSSCMGHHVPTVASPWRQATSRLERRHRCIRDGSSGSMVCS